MSLKQGSKNEKSPKSDPGNDHLRDLSTDRYSSAAWDVCVRVCECVSVSGSGSDREGVWMWQYEGVRGDVGWDEVSWSEDRLGGMCG